MIGRLRPNVSPYHASVQRSEPKMGANKKSAAASVPRANTLPKSWRTCRLTFSFLSSSLQNCDFHISCVCVFWTFWIMCHLSSWDLFLEESVNSRRHHWHCCDTLLPTVTKIDVCTILYKSDFVVVCTHIVSWLAWHFITPTSPRLMPVQGLLI